MIFVWSLPGDKQTTVVLAALARLGAPCFFFNQHEVLDAEIELEVGAALSGTLRVGKRTLALGEVTAAYLRPYETSRIPSVERAGVGSPQRRRAVELEDVLMSWSELTPAFVVNRLSDMAPNGSKPFQAAAIQAAGFKTPETLITTDPEAVRAFAKLHGALIYKSISGVRSIVSRLSAKHEERLAEIRWCPTQFQRQIAGQDYRVHVVGDELFVSRIVSSADDYRYASRQKAGLRIELGEVPQDVAERCRKMAHAMRLWVAGVDLRRTPDGDWYCFEVNPSPGFTYYQDACGFAMDEAIARLLLQHELRKGPPKP
jgi:hypothetical protein